jgi:valyl-tRNA synthetase
VDFKPRFDLKRWDIKLEEELIKKWEEISYKVTIDFHKDDKYIIIDTPPPYPSGRWGVAQAAHYTQIDMIGRYFRMRGYKVLLPFYADRNGLPAEVATERRFGVHGHEMSKTPEGREKFLNLVKKVLDEIEADLVNVWKRLGCSYDYWRNGTDSPQYRRVTQATFIELWKRGLIYKSTRPVTWCPRCGTTLAEAEIEFKEEKGKLYYVKFKIKETGQEVIIATTRPELLNACAAVIYNPEDSRYKHLKGKHAIVPLYGKEVPIFEHEYAKPEFGTGLVMMCSYGDVNDVWFFREMGLKPIVLINPDGTMNEEAGFLKGLKVREAREAIASKLKEEGLIAKEEDYPHEIPVCWRCGTPIEYIHTEEYFIKQLDFKDQVLEIANKMIFKPPEHKIKLETWINSLGMDWPISRSRYYGTEIPIWRCRRCGYELLPEPGKYVRPWKDPAPVDNCPRCGAPKEELEGEKKTFDTWFDSSISVLYVTRWLDDKEGAAKALEHSLRPQGYDIIRTWLYYTIFRVWLLTGKPAFKWVRISGMGLDEKGEAMHKSKGNVIEPEPYIEKFGADAFRYWAAASGKLGSDYRWSLNMIRTGSLFVTKLVNLARFISMFPEPTEGYRLREIDKAMLRYLSKVSNEIIKAYDELDVFEPIHKLYDLAWNVFASNYVETVKSRAYGLGGFSDEEILGARYTLHRVLRTILKLLAPIMPFVTDYIWRKMYSENGVHLEKITDEELRYDEGSEELMLKLMEVNSAIWKYKKLAGLRLSQPIEGTLYIPEEIRPIAEDVKVLHKIAEIKVGKPEKWDKQLNDYLFLVFQKEA